MVLTNEVEEKTNVEHNLSPAVRKIVSEKKIDIQSANIIWKPNLTVKIEKEDELNKLIKLNEELEDNDDVQNCFSNLDFDSELLEVNNA